MNHEIFEMADKLKAAKERKKELETQVKEVGIFKIAKLAMKGMKAL